MVSALVALSLQSVRLTIENRSFIVYFSRESKVTLLLKDALGGNCRTKALVTLHPSDSSSLATVLETAGQLAQVQNYPVVNDFMAKVCSQTTAG